jgi:cell division protein FtsZ
MAEMGKAMMGTGEAEGEGRAIRAAELAISNPLLEDNNMEGARGLLINITGGEDMTLFEVDQAANRIREEVDEDANIIFGSAIDDSLAGKVRVSVVATGIDSLQAKTGERPRLVAVPGGVPQAGNGGPQTITAGAANGAPVMVGNIAVALQAQGHGQPGHGHQGHAQPAASPAVLRGPSPPAPPTARPPVPGARPQAGYTLQPAAPRYQAPPVRPDSEAPAGSHEAADQAAAQGQRPAPPRPPQPVPAQQRAGQRQIEPRIPGRSASLFAEPPPASPPPVAAPRPSLFGRVTGAFRGQPAEPAAPPTRPQPQQQQAAPQPSYEPEQAAPDPRGEAPRASVRPASGEDSAMDIPAFLRRQSS